MGSLVTSVDSHGKYEVIGMVKKALATGNEEEVNPEADMGHQFDELAQAPEGFTHEGAAAEPNGEITQESETTEQEQADQEAAGVNVDAQDEKRAKNRQRNALFKKVRNIGEAFGAGKTSMIELAAEVTEAAVNKTVGESDAEELYKEFRKMADKRATTDAGLIPDDDNSETSLTQQVSKVRTFIRLGNGMEEAVDIVQRAIAVHLTAKAANPKAVMKGSTYTVLGSIVTEQLREKYAGQPMTDEQMHKHIARDIVESGPVTAATKVRQALDAAISAQKGNHGDKSYRAPLVSKNLEDAIDALYAALGDASPAAQAEFDKELAEAEQKARDAEERKANKGKKSLAAQFIATGKI
jgi:hypothetical protein